MVETTIGLHGQLLQDVAGTIDFTKVSNKEDLSVGFDPMDKVLCLVSETSEHCRKPKFHRFDHNEEQPLIVSTDEANYAERVKQHQRPLSTISTTSTFSTYVLLSPISTYSVSSRNTEDNLYNKSNDPKIIAPRTWEWEWLRIERGESTGDLCTREELEEGGFDMVESEPTWI